VFKLNTNASLIGTGVFRLGGILRDSTGNFLIGFPSLKSSSNVVRVKAKAILIGLQICNSNNYRSNQIIIKIDVKAMI
jgi:hypothetical protein